MAVKIRLTRTGKKKQPSYRVVVADSRSPRDGRYLEQIGRYHPLSDPSEIEIDNERARYWLSVGAQPSDAVRKLLEISGALDARPVKVVHDPKVHVVGEEAQIEAAADDEAVVAAAGVAVAAEAEVAADEAAEAAEEAAADEETPEAAEADGAAETAADEDEEQS
ncbi:MAG: 30S ribosomal protein S16 [Actinobacteria bacterium]|nr:30S ribosomal protein S16 [Actinomycetota bacterium]